MSKPKILILSFSDIAADARVLKQVRLLSGRFEVETCGYGVQPDGASRHFRIPTELAVWRYSRRDVVMRRYKHAYWSNAAIVHARIALQPHSWDVVLANDVDSVGLALALHPKLGVHVDLHEYAPRQKADMTRWRLLVAPFIRWMCRSFVRRASSVTTVGAGIADAYKREFGIDAEVVTNAAPYAELSPTATSDPIRLVHSGACLRDRNIGAIVDAVERTRSRVALDLYLTPNDPQYLEELKKRAQRSKRIVVRDPVPYERLSATLNGFDVGIHILPPVSFNNRWALPNKFFDYIQARLGVIIGPSPEMVNVMRGRGIGAIADDFTVESLVTELDALNVETVDSWKRAADAAASELSSEKQVAIWAAAIDRLVQRDSA